MPRREPPDIRAAEVLLRGMDLEDGPRWMIAEERTGRVKAAIDAAGGSTRSWIRTAGPWSTEGLGPAPAAGAADAVVLRLPRSRESLGWAAEVLASRVSEGAPLYLTGCNDEGIKSAAKHTAPWWAHAETVSTKYHARTWRLTRTGVSARGTVEAVLAPTTLRLPGGPATLCTAPGVFAGGDLDPGTAMLVDALHGLDDTPESVLDFACGIGALTEAVRQRHPDATLHALDADALAVAAFRAGVPGVPVSVGDGWGALADLPVPDRGYDWIVSNPPLHRVGKALDLSVMDALVAGAADRLAPGGRLAFVTQRQRAVRRALRDAFGQPEVLAEDGRFRVWSVRRR